MTEAPEQDAPSAGPASAGAGTEGRPPAGDLPEDLPWRIEADLMLAASAPWLGAVLNIVPGLGTGYIYQRRWRAYWLANLVAAAWILLGGRLRLQLTPLNEADDALIGTAGLLALALVTAVEAFLAARKARQTDG